MQSKPFRSELEDVMTNWGMAIAGLWTILMSFKSIAGF